MAMASEPRPRPGGGLHPKIRCTRFVCISDTHNCTVKLPKGDVLIHAGDLTNQGTYSELSKTVQWLEKADFEAKIVIAGNHDITLDPEFYAEYGLYFHNQRPESPPDCLSLLKASPTIIYLSHSSTTIRLRDPNGPHTKFTIFGSPYSPRRGLWAFSYPQPTSSSPPPPLPPPPANTPGRNRPAEVPATQGPDASALWSAIPLSADVVVTHTPPRHHLDEATGLRRAMGCEELRRALWRVRPRLAVCGHVHEGRGAERVRWDIEGGPGSSHTRYAEQEVLAWGEGASTDPSPSAGTGDSRKKISLVDLTADTRLGRDALDNDGGVCPGCCSRSTAAVGSRKSARCSTTTCPDTSTSGCSGTGYCCSASCCCSTCGSCGGDCSCGSSMCGGGKTAGDGRVVGAGLGTFGMGGDPEGTVRCDRPALLGRMGRRETCIVNCAIMVNSYPHVGGKKFNKPIVVDLDLPVWSEEDDDDDDN